MNCGPIIFIAAVVLFCTGHWIGGCVLIGSNIQAFLMRKFT